MGNIEVYCPPCPPAWLAGPNCIRAGQRGEQLGRRPAEWRRGCCKGDNKAQTRTGASFIFILTALHKSKFKYKIILPSYFCLCHSGVLLQGTFVKFCEVLFIAKHAIYTSETQLCQSYFCFNPGRHLLLNVNDESMSCKIKDYYFHQNSAGPVVPFPPKGQLSNQKR